MLVLSAVALAIFVLFQRQIAHLSCSAVQPLENWASESGPERQALSSLYRLCPRPASKTVGSQTEWNLFYHLGGNGPWIPKIRGIAEGDLDPPNGCDVSQVHMVGYPVTTLSASNPSNSAPPAQSLTLVE